MKMIFLDLDREYVIFAFSLFIVSCVYILYTVSIPLSYLHKFESFFLILFIYF